MTFITGTNSPFEQFPPNSVISPVSCVSAVLAGDWVYMDSGGTAQLALADSAASSNVIGLCEAKLSVTSCVIRFQGLSDYEFAGLDTTQEYHLSAVSAGKMSTTVPVATGEILLRLGQPLSATSFVVNKGIRIERA